MIANAVGTASEIQCQPLAPVLDAAVSASPSPPGMSMINGKKLMIAVTVTARPAISVANIPRVRTVKRGGVVDTSPTTSIALAKLQINSDIYICVGASGCESNDG